MVSLFHLGLLFGPVFFGLRGVGAGGGVCGGSLARLPFGAFLRPERRVNCGPVAVTLNDPGAECAREHEH
jgi:hypothetical protein